MTRIVPTVLRKVERNGTSTVVNDVPLGVVTDDLPHRRVGIGNRIPVGTDSTLREVSVEATGRVTVKSHLRATAR